MKKYVDYSVKEYYGCEVCEITAQDLRKAKAEWEKFQGRRGDIYNLDPKKEPMFSRFCALFFGIEPEGDAWCYTDFPYTIPCKIICTNKNVAQQAYEFLKPLDSHDTFNQTYRSISLEKNIVEIYSGDY